MCVRIPDDNVTSINTVVPYLVYLKMNCPPRHVDCIHAKLHFVTQKIAVDWNTPFVYDQAA